MGLFCLMLLRFRPGQHPQLGCGYSKLTASMTLSRVAPRTGMAAAMDRDDYRSEEYHQHSPPRHDELETRERGRAGAHERIAHREPDRDVADHAHHDPMSPTGPCLTCPFRFMTPPISLREP